MISGIIDEKNILPDRDCGPCALCCKVMRIDALQKPEGIWCPHCVPGKGCRIYETRQDECRIFYCLWRADPDLGDAWQPARCKMVLYTEGMGQRLVISVDPGNPTKWREEPWYSQIKAWSFNLLRYGQVVVYIANRAIVVFPNKEVDLGPLKKGDIILTTENNGVWDAMLGAEEERAQSQPSRWFDTGGKEP
jgi:hypothetical protein